MSIKILVVDDEPSARQTLENLLIAEGYTMRFAPNGADGLALATAWQPDAILCDVMMPEMDGFEFCRRVRADAQLAQVPLLLVTVLNDRESKLRGLEVGADDFLSKPFDTAELRARVRTTARLNRYRQLVNERARLTWVLENSDDGYLIVTPEDRIQFANARARLYLGLTDERTANAPIYFLETARRQYQLEPAEAWQTWTSTPDETTRYLVRAETDTAQAFWLQAQTLSVPNSDMTERLVLLRDITVQVATQNRWASFAQALSHKLRTPVGNIYSVLDLMHSTASSMSKEKILHLLPLAYDAAVRLKDQLEDVMQYLHAPQVNARRQRFEIAELRTLVATMSNTLNLQATTIIAPAADTLALPWSMQTMETILWEILENAQKFHPQHTPHIEIQVTQIGNQVHLQFRDDGITLSPEQLTHAWTPFYQGEKYQTGELAGMGLGLALVALLVWNVGGTYRLFNRTDRSGTVIELILYACELK